jgi:hypothetical protein
MPPCTRPIATKLYFGIESILKGIVTFCGPRQFGWSDIESALTTLIFWLYLSGAVITTGGEETEMKLDHRRIRQFSKTILGGRCREGLYREADDVAIDLLHHWLKWCLLIKTEEFGDREIPLISKATQSSVLRKYLAVAEFEDLESPSVGWSLKCWTIAVPSEKWVRESLAMKVSPGSFG